MPVHVFFIIRPGFFLQIYSPIRLKIIYKHCIAAQYPCIFIVLLGSFIINILLVHAQYPCIFIVLLGFSLISRILVLSSVPLYIYSPIRLSSWQFSIIRSSVPLYIYSPIRPQTRALVSDHCPHPQAAESALSYKIIRIYSNQCQYTFSL